MPLPVNNVWMQRHKLTLMIVGAFVLLLLAIAAKFGIGMWMGMKQGGFSFSMSVTTQPVQVRRMPVYYETVGTLEAQEQIALASEIQGRVDNIAVSEGQWVQKGQPLILLRADKQTAQANQAYEGLQQASQQYLSEAATHQAAQANTQSAKADLELAQADYDRYQVLFDKEFVTAQERDEKKAALEKAKAAYQAAVSNETSAEARYKGTMSSQKAQLANYQFEKARLGDTTIRAPFGGVVGERFVFLGDLIQPGDQLMTLVKTNPIKVTYSIPEEYLAHVRAKDPVVVTASSYLNKAFSGQVLFVSPSVNINTHMATVKAVLSDPSHTLKAGQYVQVKTLILEKPNALVVPEESLIAQGEKFLVFVNEEGTAKQRTVTIGAREPGWVEITKGLSSGEKVVTAGVHKLQDGVPIKEASEADTEEEETSEEENNSTEKSVKKTQAKESSKNGAGK